MSVLRLGTRASALATRQSGHVADALRALGHRVELVEVSTHGDRSSASLVSIGGSGVFASALREALHRGEVDLAVHSLKDLPTVPEPGLVVAAVPTREDPRDVLVARDGLTLAELPAGSRVGTGSPRRAAQLAALGLGLHVVDIRGNVDTRISLVTRGELDAVVLARSGLLRLGRAGEATQVLDPLQMLPAPGQGALAVECRSQDARTVQLLGELDDLPSRVAVSAERALLAALEAGCTAPIGALAEVVDGEQGPEVWLRSVLGTSGGAELRRSHTQPLPAERSTWCASAVAAGERLAAVLLEDGAGELIDPPPRQPGRDRHTEQHQHHPGRDDAPQPVPNQPDRPAVRAREGDL